MTLAELQEEIKKDPTTVQTALAHLVTLPEGKEVLDNYAKQETPKLVEAATAEAFKTLEGKILTITGGTKTDGQTFEVFVGKLAEDLKKAKADAAKGGDEASKQKITELETQLNGYKTANWEGKYNTLAAETSKKIEEYDTKIKGMEEGNLASVVNTDLATAYGKLGFNPNIPKEAIEALKTQVDNSVLKYAKVVDGKPVYHKEDGTPMLNGVFKPITAEEIYRTQMASIIQGGKAPGGGAPGGTPGTVVKPEGSEKRKLSLDTNKFNTKLSFANYAEEVLTSEGVEKGSKEWNDMLTDAHKEYGVDKMERV